MAKAIILFLDASRGKYIPRDFAQSMVRDCIKGIDTKVLDFLAQENSAESEFYWEEWIRVVDDARIIYEGYEYILHHDGDLWLLQYGLMSEQERIDFGFED